MSNLYVISQMLSAKFSGFFLVSLLGVWQVLRLFESSSMQLFKSFFSRRLEGVDLPDLIL